VSFAVEKDSFQADLFVSSSFSLYSSQLCFTLCFAMYLNITLLYRRMLLAIYAGRISAILLRNFV
jgi:hypothetical protein